MALPSLTPRAFAWTPPYSNSSDQQDITVAHSPVSTVGQDQRHVNLYYKNFHRLHPFLLPQHQNHIRPPPTYLLEVMALIGSQYCAEKHSIDFNASIRRIPESCTERTLESVQARLLCAILLHAQAQSSDAAVELDKAVDLALELGLQHESFAASQNSPLVAESCRRTWWELYTIDGFFTAFHHKVIPRTSTIEADTLLPGEDLAYEGGFPLPPTLSFPHLRRRALLDETLFSSYALRIEAVSVLARVLSANDPEATTNIDAMQGLDGFLSTWTTSLPDAKSKPLTQAGHDELLFQSLMTIQMSTIYLHLPRAGPSSLRSQTPVIACANPSQRFTPFLDPKSHARKASQAAKHLAALAALTSDDTERHTPFFICALVLVAIVNLSAIAADPNREMECETMDRISLALGLLRGEAGTWDLARGAHAQLKKIAAAAAGSAAGTGQEGVVGQGVGTGLEGAETVDFEALLAEMWWVEGACCSLPGMGEGGVAEAAG